eukprot:6188728-Pleurochrysis_carterae.AAC.1
MQSGRRIATQVLAFGHLMFEMLTGHELNDAELAAWRYAFMPRHRFRSSPNVKSSTRRDSAPRISNLDEEIMDGPTELVLSIETVRAPQIVSH